jgi:hypothetical protein
VESNRLTGRGLRMLVSALGFSFASIASFEAAAGLPLTRLDKINAAVPLAEPLITSQRLLEAELRSSPDSEAVNSEFRRLLEARAVQCGGNIEVGFFETPASIQSKIADRSCFSRRDDELLDWVGIRRAVLALRKPALVPFEPLPAATTLPLQRASGAGAGLSGSSSETSSPSPWEQTDDVTVSPAANVGVLRSRSGKLIVVRLPSGSVINSFKAPAESWGAGLTSPNGRVAAVPVSPSAMRFIDLESGNTLWSTDKYAALVAWLPEVQAAILLEKGTGKPVLFDQRSGSIRPYGGPVAAPKWAVAVPGKPGRYVIGDWRLVAVVDHIRGPDGSVRVGTAKIVPPAGSRIESAVWRGTEQRNPPPFVMAAGRKLVYMTDREVAWLDLESGEQGKWPRGAIDVLGYAQVSDTEVYVNVYGGKKISGNFLFDVQQQTLTAAQPINPVDGILLPLATDRGYLIRASGSVILGSSMPRSGAPRQLEALIAEATLERQSAAAESTAAAAVAISRLEESQKVVGPRTPLPGVPPNAHVSAIDVYEGETQRTTGIGVPGRIDVNLIPSKTPVVLVLSNYEAVEWNITPNGRPIAAVLLAGNKPATVKGYAGNVVVIGSQYAYAINTKELQNLRDLVAKYVSQPVRVFQGTYSGKTFSVPAD